MDVPELQLLGYRQFRFQEGNQQLLFQRLLRIPTLDVCIGELYRMYRLRKIPLPGDACVFNKLRSLL